MEMEEKSTRKRRVGAKNGGKGKKKKLKKTLTSSSDKFKVTMKNKKLYQKRARDYNSDDDEENDENKSSTKQPEVTIREKIFSDANMGPNYDEIAEDEDGSDDKEDDDSEGEVQSGITKFATEGSNAFRNAFNAIMKKTKGEDDTLLGPVLSVHKHLLAEKLAEEKAERKAKGQARKAKHLVDEKGHVKPEKYLDSHEKVLIGVATKGVVKLFNAVNKAQHAQKGLNPSRSKDAKVLRKRRKEAFFSELGKTSKTDAKDQKPSNSKAEDAPGWAPLRDNYMLANPKLKDWDKKQETIEGDDFAALSGDESYED